MKLVFSECDMCDRLKEVAGVVALCSVGYLSVCLILIEFHTFLVSEVGVIICCASDL